MTSKKKAKNGASPTKGTTLADLRRQLDETGRLSVEDVYSLVDAVNEGRRREREILSNKNRRKKTGSFIWELGVAKGSTFNRTLPRAMWRSSSKRALPFAARRMPRTITSSTLEGPRRIVSSGRPASATARLSWPKIVMRSLRARSQAWQRGCRVQPRLNASQGRHVASFVRLWRGHRLRLGAKSS